MRAPLPPDDRATSGGRGDERAGFAIAARPARGLAADRRGPGRGARRSCRAGFRPRSCCRWSCSSPATRSARRCFPSGPRCPATSGSSTASHSASAAAALGGLATAALPRPRPRRLGRRCWRRLTLLAALIAAARRRQSAAGAAARASGRRSLWPRLSDCRDPRLAGNRRGSRSRSPPTAPGIRAGASCSHRFGPSPPVPRSPTESQSGSGTTAAAPLAARGTPAGPPDRELASIPAGRSALAVRRSTARCCRDRLR